MEAGRRFSSVSAVVPVFNGSETLERCLSSLRAQGGVLREIIVVDDASKDSSAEIIESFVASDPRFVPLGHGENQGLARTLNDGIARAAGDAILIVQQDSELLGKEWVDQGLTLLDANHPCCISAHPTYRFQEMAPVDTAFGILRDHFSRMEADRDELAFSEFKCDLLPRSVLNDNPFETKFRVSGEDQVMSIKLWRKGYPILRFRQLNYVQRFGNASSVALQIRKEMIYGKTEGGVLLRTAFGVASRSMKSRTSRRRLRNRLSALVGVAGLSSFLVLLGVGGVTVLLLAPLLLVASRDVVLGLRGRALLKKHGVAPSSLGLAILLAPLADSVYVGSLFSGLFAFILAEKV